MVADSKTKFTSSTETKLAIELGTLLFNQGYKKTFTDICSSIGIDVTDAMILQWEGLDKTRSWHKKRKTRRKV